MILEKIELRKLVAEDGKIIVSKATIIDENGIEIPSIKSKEIYLGSEDKEDNYLEIEIEEEL